MNRTEKKGVSPREMMAAEYDRINKRNRHRVDVFRPTGERVFRFYDYGDADYLIRWYYQIIPAKYIVKVFEVKK